MTTRSPWLAYGLAPAYGSSTDADASLICMNSGSSPSAPPKANTMAQRVPTLPTPTTFCAMSTERYRKITMRRSSGKDARYSLTIALHAWVSRLSRSVSSWIPKRSEEHTSELQSPDHLVCRLLLEKKKKEVRKKECLTDIDR